VEWIFITSRGFCASCGTWCPRADHEDMGRIFQVGIIPANNDHIFHFFNTGSFTCFLVFFQLLRPRLLLHFVRPIPITDDVEVP
jgi:hypothetical protein